MLLLDTQALLWAMRGEGERLGSRARAAVLSPAARLTVSGVTIWEAAIKRTLGKLGSSANLLERVEASTAVVLPITARHADHVATLPLHHGDPFDRLLVAQAQLEGLTIVSGDPNLRRYDVEILW